MSVLVIGIDEAGRGPLIGDMVVAGVAAEPRVFEKLASLGVRDSKLLTPAERLRLYRTILSSGVLAVLVYAPPRILDNENLNTVEVRAVTRILGVIAELAGSSVSEVHVFIDEIKGWRASIETTLRELFKCSTRLIVEPHADAKYTPVAAASIVAKVSRDLNLTILRRVFGDFGSGYITDPDTKKWVQEYYQLNTTPPLFIRRSWRVLRELAPKWYRAKKSSKSSKSLFEFTKSTRRSHEH